MSLDRWLALALVACGVLGTIADRANDRRTPSRQVAGTTRLPGKPARHRVEAGHSPTTSTKGAQP
jgi:hypothetical protein